MSLKQKCLNVKFLVIDVDGVLTDGSIIFSEKGDISKTFKIRDGKGVQLWREVAGFKVAIATSENLELIRKRAEKMGVDELFMNRKNKFSVLKEMCQKYGLKEEEVSAIGDDINDIPILEVVGLPVAVSDAVEEVKKVVKGRGGFITKSTGGDNAVREAIETILKNKGMWDDVVKRDVERQKREL